LSRPDVLARPKVRAITSDGTYYFHYGYAAAGTLETVTYPAGPGGVRFTAKYGYSGGHLSSVQDYTGEVNGPVLWSASLLDARGNAMSEALGNGAWVQNGYDALTGLPLTRQTGTGGQSTNVQNLSYQWDAAGNLTSRQDLRQGLNESFGYDALNRLLSASGPGGTTSIAYDAIGNILSKSDVAGAFSYDPVRKHAVTSVGGTSYGYDANGNMTSRGGAAIAWSSYNLPISINSPGGYSAQFAYAPDRSRWRQVSTYAGGTETTIYVGGLLEKLTTATRTHWKHLIATPSGQVQVIRRSDGTSETLYVTTDHLGSTDAVLNASGAVVMRGSFGAYGERRASNWQGAPPSNEWQDIANTTRRGYTGHEMLDSIMLVHMNGRVFDPQIGRFLSADPYVDGADTSQGWNRYMYVHGQTLSATDPSGYGWCGVSNICISNGYGAFEAHGNPTEVIVSATRLRGMSEAMAAFLLQGTIGELLNRPEAVATREYEPTSVDDEALQPADNMPFSPDAFHAAICSGEGIGFVSGFAGGFVGGAASLAAFGPAGVGVGAILGGVTGGILGLVSVDTVGLAAGFGALGGTSTSIPTPISGAVGGVAGGLVAHGLHASGAPNVVSATAGSTFGGAVSGSLATVIEGVAGGAIAGATEGGAIGAASGASAAAAAAAMAAYCGQ
jgi:RHS repeat-associated protein